MLIAGNDEEKEKQIMELCHEGSDDTDTHRGSVFLI